MCTCLLSLTVQVIPKGAILSRATLHRYVASTLTSHGVSEVYKTLVMLSMIWTDSILFFSSFQTTTVIATQPTNTTTYVQPSSRRDSETIPTAGLIFTIIHIFVCLSFGNLAIFVCLIPALICAIVVSLDLIPSSGMEGRGALVYYCH